MFQGISPSPCRPSRRYDALEPYIDEQTMRIHHQHLGFRTWLPDAASKTPHLGTMIFWSCWRLIASITNDGLWYFMILATYNYIYIYYYIYIPFPPTRAYLELSFIDCFIARSTICYLLFAKAKSTNTQRKQCFGEPSPLPHPKVSHPKVNPD